MLKIFSNYRRVYIMRNEQQVEVTSGDEITEDEFSTIVCEGDVVCIYSNTGVVLTYTAGTLSVPVEIQQTVEPTQQTAPATNAGVVPVSVDARSTPPKA